MASESTAQEVDPIDELDRLEQNDGSRARAEEQGVELPPDTPDPSAGISDAPEPAAETERLYAGKFRSEEELERGYTNLETELGRQGNELGAMRRELEQYRQTYQPPQAEQQGSGLEPEPLSREQLDEMLMNDPLSAVDYIASMRAAEMVGMLYQEIGQQLEPITKNVNATASRQALDELTQQYGAEMVLANKQAVAQMVSDDEQFYLDPSTRKQRLGMALAAAEFERQRAAAGGQEAQRAGNGQPAGGVGNVHVEGGSTPPQPHRETESDPILAEMEEVAPRRDLFGPRPGLFGGR